MLYGAQLTGTLAPAELPVLQRQVASRQDREGNTTGSALHKSIRAPTQAARYLSRAHAGRRRGTLSAAPLVRTRWRTSPGRPQALVPVLAAKDTWEFLPPEGELASPRVSIWPRAKSNAAYKAQRPLARQGDRQLSSGQSSTRRQADECIATQKHTRPRRR